MILSNALNSRVGNAHPTIEGIQYIYGNVGGKVSTGKRHLHIASGISNGEAVVARGDRGVRVIPVTPKLYRLVCESGWFGRQGDFVDYVTVLTISCTFLDSE